MWISTLINVKKKHGEKPVKGYGLPENGRPWAAQGAQDESRAPSTIMSIIDLYGR